MNNAAINDMFENPAMAAEQSKYDGGESGGRWRVDDMVNAAHPNLLSAEKLTVRAQKIKLVITDVDGVLTDTGVYYSANGEALKRFSIRDGMGVERLRCFAGVDVAIITGERSGAVQQRAQKLKITELHLGVREKTAVFHQICARLQLEAHEIAYIGDDTNDTGVMAIAGLSACPADATPFAKAAAQYHCAFNGGYGAFRDFAEVIIAAKQQVCQVEHQEWKQLYSA